MLHRENTSPKCIICSRAKPIKNSNYGMLTLLKSLKSGPETRDPGPWDPGPWNPRLCDPGPETLRLVTLGLWNWDPGPWDLHPWDMGSWHPGPWGPGHGTLWLATDPHHRLTLNFDHKKLGHVCRKRRSSNTKIEFSNIFCSFLCQK